MASRGAGLLVRDALVGKDGTQQSPLGYPIFRNRDLRAVPRFYRAVLLPPRQALSLAGDMI